MIVCVSVCQTITFESLDVGSSYLHSQCISRESGSVKEFDGCQSNVKKLTERWGNVIGKKCCVVCTCGAALVFSIILLAYLLHCYI